MGNHLTVNDFRNADVVYDRELSNEETIMRRRGYPFVHTVSLPPAGRLNCHGHNSTNDHLITQGYLDITPQTMNPVWAKSSKYPYLSLQIPPGVLYEAVAGPDGCTFVEAHTQLSPTTALRFTLGGTMRLATANDPRAGRMRVSTTASVVCGRSWRQAGVIIVSLIVLGTAAVYQFNGCLD